LHVEEVFLKGLKFENLMLSFNDGYIDEYSCSNFKEKEENEKYIKDNILYSHNTLPMGEFAIGTNTTAYAMAQKFKITHLLPILIVEKMGPHFAIGDTCYSWEEDEHIYNPLNRKEIVAKENEKSAKRHENINEAYTNCHTDITLPYNGIESIDVILKDKSKIKIIKDGRFVLKGAEELNDALD
jgi:aminopeptidase